MRIKNLHIIINPAAGKMEPILPVINSVLKDTGINWDVFVTKDSGDAFEFAKDAVQEKVDAVAVYGGDGTLMEVVSGVMGSQVPIIILPGGTANIMAKEMGIPQNLEEACRAMFDAPVEVKAVDIGQFGKKYFLIRTAIGFEADMVSGADRKVKNRLGILAYTLSFFQSLKKICNVRYDLTVDGVKHKAEGLTCIIANSGNVGMGKISIDKHISVNDGLLDVLVVRRAGIQMMAHMIATVIRRERAERWELVEHWQGKDINIHVTPVQTVQCDGEPVPSGSVHVKVIPSAISMLVPKEEESKGLLTKVAEVIKS
jgi:diacylglycerol kinase (ATP)